MTNVWFRPLGCVLLGDLLMIKCSVLTLQRMTDNVNEAGQHEMMSFTTKYLQGEIRNVVFIIRHAT